MTLLYFSPLLSVPDADKHTTQKANFLQNDKKTHKESWDNNHFSLIFTHNYKQIKKTGIKGAPL